MEVHVEGGGRQDASLLQKRKGRFEMKWVLLVVAAAGGVVGVIAIAGALLPKVHVASRRARFRQPAEQIWKAITEFTAFPGWRPEVVSVETLPSRDGHVLYLEKGRQGNITMEIMEAVRPQRLVVRIGDPGVPFGGSWTYLLSPGPNETSLTITENGEIHNPMLRFFARFIFGHQRSIESYLRALGKRFGEKIILERAA